MTNKDSGRRFAFSNDLLAVIISSISLFLSVTIYYVNSLKAPDISFVIAPFISHIVDGTEFDETPNEGFYIPLTIINRGARTGTLLSFNLIVEHVATGNQREYSAQFFTVENASGEYTGNYFAPISINGYSSTSKTICFYVDGNSNGTFFSELGKYDFQVTAVIANVKNEIMQTMTQSFSVELTDAMYKEIQLQPDLEYVYPIRIGLELVR